MAEAMPLRFLLGVSMKPEFQVGLRHEIVEETLPQHAAPHLAKPVFSTPAMVGFMERCSVGLIKPYLEEGENSVGFRICVTHIAATPIGQKVRVTSTVKAIEGRRITFAVEAFNEKEKIGEGEHTRVLIRPK
ncbi:MAG TPA: thioesterase family protein [Terriglobia bacterium]|nr:thioesterase family protein [Terriglobia bacterium]